MRRPIERAWHEIRLHLKHAKSFSVLYLFCSEARLVVELQRRALNFLELRARTQRVLRADSADGFLATLTALVASAQSDADRVTGAPVWLDWSRAVTDIDTEALSVALTRLNTSRSTLEQQFQRVLIVVLPEDAMPVVAAAAPDMWHIRTLSEILVSTPHELASLGPSQAAPYPQHESLDGVKLVEADFPEPYRLWLSAEAKATDDAARAALPLWVADEAVRALLSRGAFAQAADVADDMRELSAARINTGDLSLSWNRLGDIARARNRLDDAE